MRIKTIETQPWRGAGQFISQLIGAIAYIIRHRNVNQSSKPKSNGKRYAAVELGGTSIRVAIAEGKADNIVERDQFPTTTPDKDIPKLIQW